jgi:hypothetical protein
MQIELDQSHHHLNYEIGEIVECWWEQDGEWLPVTILSQELTESGYFFSIGWNSSKTVSGNFLQTSDHIPSADLRQFLNGDNNYDEEDEENEEEGSSEDDEDAVIVKKSKTNDGSTKVTVTLSPKKKLASGKKVIWTHEKKLILITETIAQDPFATRQTSQSYAVISDTLNQNPVYD